LIITPQRLTTADKYVDSPVSGMMAQLYSVRSEKSWGMGDFGDLGDLAEIAAKKAGADFLLINPLHADRKSTRLNSSHVSISYAVHALHSVPTRRSSDL